MRKNIKWIVLFIAVFIFMIIAKTVWQNENIKIDEIIYGYISSWINPILTNVFKFITYFGSALPIITISAIILITEKNRKYSKYIIMNLIIIFIFNQVLKFIFQRPRPSINRLVQEGGFSFPSGHSMVSAGFYGLLTYLAFKNIENKKIRYVVTSCLIVLILLIGISRIYLGVHYASDVIGAFCISIAYLVLFTHITKIGTKERFLGLNIRIKIHDKRRSR